MLSSLDLILVVVSVALMVAGFARRYKMWRQGRPDGAIERKTLKGGGKILLSVFRHRRSSEYPYGNTAHLFVFWGFIIPFAVVIISQLHPVLPAPAGRAISVFLDLVGLLAIAGTVMLLLKRARDKGNYSGGQPVHLWILLAVLVTGFIAEGIRLALTKDGTIGMGGLYSPVGYLFSWVVPASPVILKAVARAHFFLVLIFIAYLPYSNMRHALASLLGIYYQDRRPGGAITHLDLHGDYFGFGAVKDLPWTQLMDSDACMNCGRCNMNCPANISGKPLMPQGIIRAIGSSMEEAFSKKGAGKNQDARIFSEDGLIGREDIWSCTTCMACVKTCPVFAGHLTDIIGLRRFSVLMESRFPPEYKQVFKNTETFGDPFGAGNLMREDWTAGHDLQRAGEDGNVDTLLWVGCTGALYDEVSRERTIEIARMLKKAGVSFGILGKGEACCGDPARRLGNEYLFQRMASKNIETMKKCGIKKIVASCPHCFNVIRNEYPQLGGDFEVVHITQLIKELLEEGKLKIKSKNRGQLTYHDPCYLGRYNGILKEPREIIGMFSEEGIKEMKSSGDNGFCCGAGGGNFWCGRAKGRRIEEIRIEQAIETGAAGLVTSCPFCEIMFDSAVRQKGAEHSLKVMDIVQLVNQSTE